MKTRTTLVASMLLLVTLTTAQAQEEIKTIFSGGKIRSGGYGAIGNQFTSIGGEFANLTQFYGGWYINRKFLIGAGGSASTNYIPVPLEHSASPGDRMSYLYGQVGLVNEFVLGSNKAVHLVFHLFNGAGYTLQYNRTLEYDQSQYQDYNHDYPKDMNWFFVAEPGVQVEINLLKWMRLSPGVSYRYAQGSNGRGLSDNDISGANLNMTLKFGKF